MRADHDNPSIYLDHAAAALPMAGLYRRWGDLAARYFVNPHGTTRQSADCKKALRAASRRILSALGIPPQEAEVIWTSGGTEAINLAVHGVLSRETEPTCAVDSTGHAALLESAVEFGRLSGGHVQVIPVNECGQLQFGPVMPASIDLVGVTHVNNETGVVQDLVNVRASLNGRRGLKLLLVDALQSAGRMALPWREAGIDMVAAGSRKIGGPPGLGILIIRKALRLAPLMYGGGQQTGVRSGTVDTAAAVLFADVLCQRVGQAREQWERLVELRARLLAGIAQMRVFRGITVSPADASPYITCISFPGFEGAILVRLLAERGVIVGSGSACTAESAEPSQVLTAMGLSSEVARGALRISFGPESTTGDVARLIDQLRAVLESY